MLPAGNDLEGLRTWHGGTGIFWKVLVTKQNPVSAQNLVPLLPWHEQRVKMTSILEEPYLQSLAGSMKVGFRAAASVFHCVQR